MKATKADDLLAALLGVRKVVLHRDPAPVRERVSTPRNWHNLYRPCDYRAGSIVVHLPAVRR